MPAKRSEQTAEFRIGQYTVTMNADDVKRVSRQMWKPTQGDQNVIHFYTDIGTLAQPHFVLLQNFILSAPGNVYVDFIDRSKQGLDCRRSNLRQSRAATTLRTTR